MNKRENLQGKRKLSKWELEALQHTDLTSHLDGILILHTKGRKYHVIQTRYDRSKYPTAAHNWVIEVWRDAETGQSFSKAYTSISCLNGLLESGTAIENIVHSLLTGNGMIAKEYACKYSFDMFVGQDDDFENGVLVYKMLHNAGLVY